MGCPSIPHDPRIRVLLVEDHPLTRAGLRDLINDARDMTVVGEVGNGEDALKCMEAVCPDVAVLDMRLPDMRGSNIIGELLAICPDTAVLALSSFAFPAEVEHVLANGALGYILKDAARREVVAAVRSVYGGKRVVRGRIAEDLAEFMMIEKLTERERAVLARMAEGGSNKVISRQLCIAPSTVKVHVGNILFKLDASNRMDAVVRAAKLGLVRIS